MDSYSAYLTLYDRLSDLRKQNPQRFGNVYRFENGDPISDVILQVGTWPQLGRSEYESLLCFLDLDPVVNFRALGPEHAEYEDETFFTTTGTLDPRGGSRLFKLANPTGPMPRSVTLARFLFLSKLAKWCDLYSDCVPKNLYDDVTPEHTNAVFLGWALTDVGQSFVLTPSTDVSANVASTNVADYVNAITESLERITPEGMRHLQNQEPCSPEPIIGRATVMQDWLPHLDIKKFRRDHGYPKLGLMIHSSWLTPTNLWVRRDQCGPQPFLRVPRVDMQDRELEFTLPKLCTCTVSWKMLMAKVPIEEARELGDCVYPLHPVLRTTCCAKCLPKMWRPMDSDLFQVDPATGLLCRYTKSSNHDGQVVRYTVPECNVLTDTQRSVVGSTGLATIFEFASDSLSSNDLSKHYERLNQAARLLSSKIHGAQLPLANLVNASSMGVFDRFKDFEICELLLLHLVQVNYRFGNGRTRFEAWHDRMQQNFNRRQDVKRIVFSLVHLSTVHTFLFQLTTLVLEYCVEIVKSNGSIPASSSYRFLFDLEEVKASPARNEVVTSQFAVLAFNLLLLNVHETLYVTSYTHVREDGELYDHNLFVATLTENMGSRASFVNRLVTSFAGRAEEFRTLTSMSHPINEPRSEINETWTKFKLQRTLWLIESSETNFELGSCFSCLGTNGCHLETCLAQGNDPSIFLNLDKVWLADRQETFERRARWLGSLHQVTPMLKLLAHLGFYWSVQSNGVPKFRCTHCYLTVAAPRHLDQEFLHRYIAVAHQMVNSCVTAKSRPLVGCDLCSETTCTMQCRQCSHAVCIDCVSQLPSTTCPFCRCPLSFDHVNAEVVVSQMQADLVNQWTGPSTCGPAFFVMGDQQHRYVLTKLNQQLVCQRQPRNKILSLYVVVVVSGAQVGRPSSKGSRGGVNKILGGPSVKLFQVA